MILVSSLANLFCFRDVPDICERTLTVSVSAVVSIMQCTIYCRCWILVFLSLERLQYFLRWFDDSNNIWEAAPWALIIGVAGAVGHTCLIKRESTEVHVRFCVVIG